jgi:hypothetical protein
MSVSNPTLDSDKTKGLGEGADPRYPNLDYANRIIEERMRDNPLTATENSVPAWSAEHSSFYTLMGMNGDRPKSEAMLRTQITLQDLGMHLTKAFYKTNSVVDGTNVVRAPLEGEYNLLMGDLPALDEEEAIIELAIQDLTGGGGGAAGGTPAQQDEEMERLKDALRSIRVRRTGILNDDDKQVDLSQRQMKMEAGLAMGEADVLNPHFQFNELDDIRSDPEFPKVGRLYGERIYNFNLPKIQFIVGQLKFKLNALTMLASNHGDTTANAEYLRSAGGHPIKWGFNKIRGLFSSMYGFLSGKFMNKTDLYEFIPAPKVYMRYVNEILQELAVYMDLAKSPLESDKYSTTTELDELEDDGDKNIFEQGIDKVGEIMSAIFGTVQSIFKNDEFDPEETAKGGDREAAHPNVVIDGMPGSDHYMGKAQTLHIYNILPGVRRHYGSNWFREGIFKGFPDFSEVSGTDFVFQHLSQMMQIQYIPFMLDKGAQINESVSNSTQPHPALETMNGASLTAQNQEASQFFDATVSAMNGDMLKGAIDTVGRATSEGGGGLTDIISGIAGSAFGTAGLNKGKHAIQGALGEFGLILNGNARMAFPEVWSDSQFDRTCSLSLKLYSPYGDRLSIFENIYVPLIFLLAMALPKAIGPNAYMTPFIVRTVAKGLFTCDLGIISSISITRGEEGMRTIEGFNRQMTVSVEIKDLMPKINMSIDGGVWGFMSTKNVGFHSYLRNLANIDIEDNISIKNRITWLFRFLGGKYNIESFGLNMRTNIAQSSVGQTISYIGRSLGMISRTPAVSLQNKEVW